MTTIYFIKTEYTGNVYKVSDFYNSNGTFLKPINRSMAVDMRFNDGTTILDTQLKKLPDGTDLHDYTHIIVPDKQKVYTIYAIDDLNADSYRLYLDDEALMANYQEMKAKEMLLTVSNDPDLFIGTNTVLDISTEKTARLVTPGSSTNYTGTWALFTFQSDVTNLTFNIGEMDNLPLVGTFENTFDLDSEYPSVDTPVPYTVEYFLKFAWVTNGVTNKDEWELYQAVFNDDDGQGVSWVRVMRSPLLNVSSGVPIQTTRYTSNVKISNLGDINTVQVAFPVDATIVQQKTITRSSASTTEYFTVPAFNSIKSWTNSDKLISIKLVPQELLNINTVERNDMRRITIIVSDGFTFSTTKTLETYVTKVIEDGYLIDNGITDFNSMNLPMYTARQFKDIFDFNNWSYLVDSPLDYEPFKTYYLYFFGEMIPIPGKYLQSGFSVRLAVTSTDVLYEVYTDKMNIIGSGRLMWFTRYSVDQLSLFEANNPTYKEQFMVNQFKTMLIGGGAGLIKGMSGGGDRQEVVGYEKSWGYSRKTRQWSEQSTNVYNTVPGGGGAKMGLAGIGASLGAVAWQSLDLMYQQKSLRLRADEVFGQNDTALTNIKGFGTYLVIIEPDADSLAQMINAYQITGFSVNTRKTLNNLPWVTNTLWGRHKLVGGKLTRVVKNNYVTNEINEQLSNSVVIIE